MASLDGRDTFKLTLQDPVNVSYCLTGRRSFIYTATIDPRPEDYSKDLVIVKFSYQATTRTPENELVGEAEVHAVGNLPEIHACQDLWVLKDTAAAADERLRTTMAKYGVDLPSDVASTPRRVEERVLRSIAYREYGPLRVLFKEKWQLIPIMVDQMLDCKYAVC